jgi:membrane protein DedA with SNARE-associated domain
MRMSTFIIYTFTGSYIWSLLLAFIGAKMGERWEYLKVYFHKFDLAIGIIIVAGAAWYVRRHINAMKTTPEIEANSKS